MATETHATTTIEIRISTSRNLRHALVEYEERVAAADRRRCVEADLQPPLDLADFADLMYRNKLHAARRLAQLADQPGGERLLYRQASAWAAYINETHLFQGDEVWFPIRIKLSRYVAWESFFCHHACIQTAADIPENEDSHAHHR